MEADNTPSQNPAQGQPGPGVPPRPLRPVVQRPMVDGFVPRRPGVVPANPAAQPQRPAAPASGNRLSIPVAGAQPPAAARPVTAAFTAPQPAAPESSGQPTASVPQPSGDGSTPDTLPSNRAKLPKEHNRTGHAGLAGFIIFILLGALLVSPLVPGKIMQNFPLSSQTFSTGNQSLDCIGTQGRISSSTSYDTKAGAPLTYTYSTSTKQSATCNGSNQTVISGRTSQFIPLGLLIDVVVALAVAIIAARVWRLLFGEKRRKR